MLSISHAATGAVIASKVGNPIVAIPLILLSHYLEDAVPHWDAGTGLGSGKKTRRDALIHGSIDLAIAGILVLVFYPSVIHDILPTRSAYSTAVAGGYSIFSAQSLSPIWGSFVGLIPDFLEAPRNFWKYEPKWLKPINAFHKSFHHSIPRMIDGLLPQFILLVILWLFR